MDFILEFMNYILKATDILQYARSRRERGVDLYNMIQEVVGSKSLAQWDPIVRANDIWFANVQSVEQVAAAGRRQGAILPYKRSFLF